MANSAAGPVVALVGNPNVGKSTVFNALTNLHQHTGNWPGKTVSTARGTYTYRDTAYTLVDLPGTYSLAANSEEEINGAKGAVKLLGGRVEWVKDYQIPGTDVIHRVVCVRKVSATPGKYPRRFALIKKQPL